MSLQNLNEDFHQIILDFIGENWADFSRHLRDNGLEQKDIEEIEGQLFEEEA